MIKIMREGIEFFIDDVDMKNIQEKDWFIRMMEEGKIIMEKAKEY